MNFDEFVNKYTNKPVDFDGAYPNQCMDLAHQYVYEVLGIGDKSVIAAPSAYQVYTNFKWEKYFERIENTPSNVPQKGDIIVFGTAVGVHGHICIFVDGDRNKFRSFDSNWPVGALPKIVEHTYKGVLGWLRYKETVVKPCDCSKIEEELDAMRDSRDKHRTESKMWQKKYEASQAENKPITAYKVMELFNALGSAIKEGRWS